MIPWSYGTLERPYDRDRMSLYLIHRGRGSTGGDERVRARIDSSIGHVKRGEPSLGA